jgi:acetyl-CoA acetyltransferase
VAKPFRLLDFCLENDTAQVFIVTSRERAYDLKQPPVFILGGIARQCSPDPAGGWNYSRPRFYIHSGIYARNRLWGNAGVRPEEIEVASIYDAVSYCVIEELEAFGFCDIGEAPTFIAEGRLGLDGKLPCNTGGGQLSEGYTHGVGLINDVVRQLRHRADDACPQWAEGKHTYDRAAGCRQVRKASLGACISEGGDTRGSALILRS